MTSSQCYDAIDNSHKHTSSSQQYKGRTSRVLALSNECICSSICRSRWSAVTCTAAVGRLAIDATRLSATRRTCTRVISNGGWLAWSRVTMVTVKWRSGERTDDQCLVACHDVRSADHGSTDRRRVMMMLVLVCVCLCVSVGVCARKYNNARFHDDLWPLLFIWCGAFASLRGGIRSLALSKYLASWKPVILCVGSKPVSAANQIKISIRKFRASYVIDRVVVWSEVPTMRQPIGASYRRKTETSHTRL